MSTEIRHRKQRGDVVSAAVATTATAVNNESPSEVVEPLDENDQARIVDQLQAESAHQQESIYRLFRYLCLLTVVLILLITIYLDQWHVSVLVQSNAPAGAAAGGGSGLSLIPILRPLSVIHGGLSAGLQGLAPPLTQPQQNSSMVYRILLTTMMGVAAITIWASRQVADLDDTILWTHYGIVGSNAFLLVLALLLRRDNEATEKVMKELVHAQYRFKSL
jgi:hypothetical protein